MRLEEPLPHRANVHLIPRLPTCMPVSFLLFVDHCLSFCWSRARHRSEPLICICLCYDGMKVIPSFYDKIQGLLDPFEARIKG